MTVQLIAQIHQHHPIMLILHQELELYTAEFESLVSAISKFWKKSTIQICARE